MASSRFCSRTSNSGLEGAQAVADRGHLAVDAFLLFSVQLTRDGAVEAAVKELLAPFHEPGLLSDERLLRALRFGCAGFHRRFESGLGHRGTLGRERNELVEVLDLTFDVVDVDRRHRAVGSLLVASDADEVGVDRPGGVLRVVDDESALVLPADLALPAEERTLQVG